ncbi:hypothetical protein J437_LFUL019456, partial [Ladona fulva]
MYGFDGTSGHTQYKQLRERADSSDEYLFMSSLVPLRLLNDATVEIKGSNINTCTTLGKIICKNPRPSSTRFSWPILLQWLKETKEVAKGEKNYLQWQIDALEKWNLGSYSVSCYAVTTALL